MTYLQCILPSVLLLQAHTQDGEFNWLSGDSHIYPTGHDIGVLELMAEQSLRGQVGRQMLKERLSGRHPWHSTTFLRDQSVGCSNSVLERHRHKSLLAICPFSCLQDAHLLERGTHSFCRRDLCTLCLAYPSTSFVHLFLIF